MAISNIGTAEIKLAFDDKDVKGKLAKLGSGIGYAAGFGIGTFAADVIGLVGTGIKMTSDMISSHMNDAINRLDTLNNYPQVMQALGHSSKEADKSLSSMDEHLDGLPTTLDAMVSDVQKLTATMGNLAKGEVNATSVGLGLNDMFLAGGKGTEAASRGIEAYNQMLGLGKVNMQDWSTLMDVAPGQMAQLAQSMLGAGKDGMDLYQALKDGTVSLEDMNAEIVKLDKEGGDGFASFTKQAIVGTQGLGTQLQNINTSITKVITAALKDDMDGIDRYTKQLTERVGETIPKILQGFGVAFKGFMKTLPRLMKELIPAVVKLVQDVVTGVVEAIPGFIQVVAMFVPELIDIFWQLIQQVNQAVMAQLPSLLQLVIDTIIYFFVSLSDPANIQMLLNTAITLLMAIVQAIPVLIQSLSTALPEIISNILAFLLDPQNLMLIIDAAVQLFLGIAQAVPLIFSSVFSAFVELFKKLWDKLKQNFSEFAASFGETVRGIFVKAVNGVLEFIENFINGPIDVINSFINAINDAFGGIGISLSTIGRVSLPRLARGGFVSSPTTALIGEAGKEAVIPLENNTDNWAGLLAHTLAEEMESQGLQAGQPSMVVNFYDTTIRDDNDIQKITQGISQAIRRAA